MLLEKQGQQAPLTQSRHKPSLCKKKNAVSVTHNKMRYACARLRFVDGKVKAQRRDDLLRVPQLLSDRNKSRLWDSSHSSHSWRGGSFSVLMLQWSLQACEQGQCRREREVKTPSLCRGSSITRCRWCFSHQHCLSGRHPWADMKADEPFPYPEDSSPATGSESNFSWQSIPPAESYTRTSQKPSPPFPSTWCYKPKSPQRLSTLVAFAVCFYTNINCWNHTRRQSVFHTRYRSFVWFCLYSGTLYLSQGRVEPMLCVGIHTCDIKRIRLHCFFLSVDVSVAKPCTCHFWKALNRCDVACGVCSAEGCLVTVSPFVSWKHFSYYCYFCRKF